MALKLRGHVRPLLHLSLNILDQHPDLYLTLLLAPSAVPRVEEELASPSLAHMHQSPNQDHSESPSLVDRLQVVPVRKTGADPAGQFALESMANEAADFADAIPGFLRALCAREDFAAGPNPHINTFAALRPNFLLVSVRDSSSLMRTGADAAVGVSNDDPGYSDDCLEPAESPACTHLHVSSLQCSGGGEVSRLFTRFTRSDYSFLASSEHGGLLAKVLDRVDEAVKAGGDVDEVYEKASCIAEYTIVG